MIDALIDKLDTFEIVREKIGEILILEQASQQVLAAAAGKDPALWKLRVFLERSNPWEQWLNDNDPTPIINVWYENSSFNPGASNTQERQKSESIYNIDCYGYGESAPDGVGHTPGDMLAANEAHRALRLARNILMAVTYRQLGLRGLVSDRWPQNISAFQPTQDGGSVQKILACRLALRVSFNEFAPTITPETLEYISTDVKRTADGELLAEADYDFISP